MQYCHSKIGIPTRIEIATNILDVFLNKYRSNKEATIIEFNIDSDIIATARLESMRMPEFGDLRLDEEIRIIKEFIEWNTELIRIIVNSHLRSGVVDEPNARENYDNAQSKLKKLHQYPYIERAIEKYKKITDGKFDAETWFIYHYKANKEEIIKRFNLQEIQTYLEEKKYNDRPIGIEAIAVWGIIRYPKGACVLSTGRKPLEDILHAYAADQEIKL